MVEQLRPEDLQRLQSFISACKQNPSILHVPQLSFFKEYLTSLGAKLPECSPPPKPEETPMKEPEPKEEEEEEVESDVELNNEGVIEPETEDPPEIGDMNKVVSEEDQDAANEKRSEAMMAMSDGDFQKAVDCFTEAIKLNPGSAMLYAKRANILLKQSRVKAAIRDCDEAIKLNPDSAAAYKFRGRAHRPRSSRSIPSLGFKEEEVMDDPQPSTSRSLLRLSNTSDPLLNLVSHSSDEECAESDVEYMPPTKRCRTEDYYDPHVARCDDSKWEDSNLEDESELSNSESDIDSVSLMSVNRCDRNAPGTSSFVWRKMENNPQRFDFTATPGVKLPNLDAASRPETIFSKFLTKELLEKIVQETNRYASQYMKTPFVNMKAWEDITVHEFRAYLGLLFLMGLQSMPYMQDFWSHDPLISSLIFSQTMSRDRFDAITLALHFVDNEADHPAVDRLWKLRPVIDVLDKQFSSIFVPNKLISVDEILWDVSGCHQALQYVPNKSACRGLKVYKLCSSDGPEAGYTTAFGIYVGKDCGEHPTSMKVVIDLMEKGGLMDKGYEIHTDNWFSSPKLFHYLQARKTSAVGTVQKNCKYMPTDLQAKGRGKIDFRSTNTGMLALQWMNKKPITMLSTVHISEIEALSPNCQEQAVLEYNHHMKGVDLSDQLGQSNRSTRKTIKWYIKIFFTLLDMAVFNSLAVHKVLGGKMTEAKFKMELVRGLLGGREVRRRRRKHVVPSPAAPVAIAVSEHMPEDTPFRRWRRCVFCWNTKRKRKETRLLCNICGVSLCPTPCFKEFHNSLDHV
ncbi:piggyBac transposable element-derived protein 4-like [Penaeus indicus]|uniref:piggyBac transposable element-derived protein 4-like n=1 Tax=Penaeus indicus TaxID=29960 RepID=UPI00300CF94E